MILKSTLETDIDVFIPKIKFQIYYTMIDFFIYQSDRFHLAMKDWNFTSMSIGPSGKRLDFI